MKRTDFAIYLNKFLTNYLVNTKGCTVRTIDSYRYSFIQFLVFMSEINAIDADKVSLADINSKNIVEYLNWLEFKRNNSVATRNLRQAAINSFIKFLMYEKPEYICEYQQILGIKSKKALNKEISYLKTDGIKLLMSQIETNTINGLRDYVMLTLLYTTGIRVSELIKIRVKELSLSYPFSMLVHGKGQKSRFVPIFKNIVSIIKRYLTQMKYDRQENLDCYLFTNHMKMPFTRQGVCYLIKKYSNKARIISPELIPNDMSPHKMRHTAAMELVSAGVDLIYIRDLLGHVSVKTTEIYARTDSKLKREAIEKVSKFIVPDEKSKWDNNVSLKDWLKGFDK